jgi:hypothetical protein
LSLNLIVGYNIAKPEGKGANHEKNFRHFLCHANFIYSGLWTDEQHEKSEI